MRSAPLPTSDALTLHLHLPPPYRLYTQFVRSAPQGTISSSRIDCRWDLCSLFLLFWICNDYCSCVETAEDLDSPSNHYLQLQCWNLVKPWNLCYESYFLCCLFFFSQASSSKSTRPLLSMHAATPTPPQVRLFVVVPVFDWRWFALLCLL
jgi:hypothetical protein